MRWLVFYPALGFARVFGFMTGYSFFDVWTAVHLAFWIFVGSCLWGFKAARRTIFLSCVAIAYLWEMFEHGVAERRWPGIWQDPESWWNSLISDPLMCVVGVLSIWWLLDHRIRVKYKQGA